MPLLLPDDGGGGTGLFPVWLFVPPTLPVLDLLFTLEFLPLVLPLLFPRAARLFVVFPNANTACCIAVCFLGNCACFINAIFEWYWFGVGVTLLDRLVSRLGGGIVCRC